MQSDIRILFLKQTAIATFSRSKNNSASHIKYNKQKTQIVGKNTYFWYIARSILNNIERIVEFEGTDK